MEYEVNWSKTYHMSGMEVIEADSGTFEKAYCVLEIDGHTFRLTDSEYSSICGYDESKDHTKAEDFFQKIADKINR